MQIFEVGKSFPKDEKYSLTTMQSIAYCQIIFIIFSIANQFNPNSKIANCLLPIYLHKLFLNPLAVNSRSGIYFNFIVGIDK